MWTGVFSRRRGSTARLQAELWALAEEQLLKAGIQIASQKDWETAPDVALLDLDVTVVCEPTRHPVDTMSAS